MGILLHKNANVYEMHTDRLLNGSMCFKAYRCLMLANGRKKISYSLPSNSTYYVLHSYTLTRSRSHRLRQPNSIDRQIWQQTNLSCVFICVTKYCNVCNKCGGKFLILHLSCLSCTSVCACVCGGFGSFELLFFRCSALSYHSMLQLTPILFHFGIYFTKHWPSKLQ